MGQRSQALCCSVDSKQHLLSVSHRRLCAFWRCCPRPPLRLALWAPHARDWQSRFLLSSPIERERERRGKKNIHIVYLYMSPFNQFQMNNNQGHTIVYNIKWMQFHVAFKHGIYGHGNTHPGPMNNIFVDANQTIDGALSVWTQTRVRTHCWAQRNKSGFCERTWSQETVSGARSHFPQRNTWTPSHRRSVQSQTGTAGWPSLTPSPDTAEQKTHYIQTNLFK